ncbi:hemolysin family protein [Phenylobacterium deserti]|uniref:Magnesium/cobalt efflux protein n=1 Tax=Phenylobacterium deserti TaxID=1914756 RepID=A0A328AQC1_9CAUL|nr:hemolysin family protein [Phenylobacterium deserti]RAK57213.1 magnesium/cobalt efflux protein [Phenylobacterium deserti]
MTDPDPSSSAHHSRKSWGVMALFNRFRKPQPEPEPTEDQAADTAVVGELVSHAREFQDLCVDDIMKPRADVVAIEQSATFAELVARFVEAEHSRMPVYKETLDEPVGVVHVKDVFRLMARRSGRPKPDDQVLQERRGLVRKVLYVPPSMPAASLLALMRGRRTHMALVIDEFGGTDGLVTLEDLLEELVGDIADEHDVDEDPGFSPVVEDDLGWVVDGRAPLEELEAAIGEGVDLAPPDLDEEIDTVGGLVNTLAGRVPARGERIEHPGGYEIEVLSADPRRVQRLRVRRPAPALEAGD